MTEPTTLETERAEQAARWPARAGVDLGRAQNLLHNEFLSADEQASRATKRLRALLSFAAVQVPYYASCIAELGADVAQDDVAAVWTALPVLEKAVLQEEAPRLRAFELPTMKRTAGETRTSGTTGQPTVVAHSRQSLSHFAWLKQREMRWFRLDPRGVMLSIRPASELPATTGSKIEPGQVITLPRWPYVGAMVETGPAHGVANTTEIEAQKRALAELKPSFLLMQAAGLEHLALSMAGSGGPPGLACCLAISQTLTQPMRDAAKRHLGVTVVQNYGLNEIGLVASQCLAGRYHVHAEHCAVEIVDEDGQPSAPGELGRVLVTALLNDAMPLIRYETGDYAIATQGLCPCGRTLPSFGAVSGRYRRVASLPKGTWPRWAAIQYAMGGLPVELAKTVSRYQAKQFSDGRWEMRVQTTADDAAFTRIDEIVRKKFDAVTEGESATLSLSKSETFFAAGVRKFQSFVSEHMPAADEAAG